ncbi:MAG TPA: sulfatase/phosphatase domain-containing protein [Sphingomonas sp.]|nr:sulfatase/phosphatase domain-containing protein [Sphingomonas sp.]
MKLDRNTIVLLWGDHGFKLSDHGAWAKHSNAEIDIRTPLIIRAPGVTRAGTRTRALVEATDIYPTLAELAGLTPPTTLEGLSKRPLFADPSRRWKSAAFAQYDRGTGDNAVGRLSGRTVRTTRYRYTAWLDRPGKTAARELYDLDGDPEESINIASNPTTAQVLAKVEAIRRGGWRLVRDSAQ